MFNESTPSDQSELRTEQHCGINSLSWLTPLIYWQTQINELVKIMQMKIWWDSFKEDLVMSRVNILVKFALCDVIHKSSPFKQLALPIEKRLVQSNTLKVKLWDVADLIQFAFNPNATLPQIKHII